MSESIPPPAAPPRRLHIFLCHASVDKPAVRDLYRRLRADGFQPWIDEEDLIAGEDWELAIRRAVREADVVVVCLTVAAATQAGYRHKEIGLALDVADEQPPGTIYIIPLRLEACDVPERLSRWHWVNLYEERGYERLVRGLSLRARDLGRALPQPSALADQPTAPPDSPPAQPPHPADAPSLPPLHPRDPRLVKARGLIARQQWVEALQSYEALAAEFTLPQRDKHSLEQARQAAWRVRASAQAEEAETRFEWDAAVALWAELAERLPNDATLAQRLAHARAEQELAEKAQDAADLASHLEWESVLALVQQIAQQRPGYRHPRIDLAALVAGLIARPEVPFAQRLRAAELVGRVSDPRFPVAIEEWRREVARVQADDTVGAKDFSPRPQPISPYFCPVAAGTYRIGGWKADEANAEIALPGFWIARFPITVAQYRVFIDAGGYNNKEHWSANGWQWKGNRTQPWGWDESPWDGANQPVIGVTWYEATAFAGWLTAQVQDALPPGYALRLPSEAEWEVAACAPQPPVHGGPEAMQRRTYPWGEEEPTVAHAVYGKKLQHPAPVGCCPAGAAACGALDMAGNVWEVTTSSYAGYPAQSERIQKDFTTDDWGVPWRGGSWYTDSTFVRCAARDWINPLDIILLPLQFSYGARLSFVQKF